MFDYVKFKKKPCFCLKTNTIIEVESLISLKYKNLLKVERKRQNPIEKWAKIHEQTIYKKTVKGPSI